MGILIIDSCISRHLMLKNDINVRKIVFSDAYLSGAVLGVGLVVNNQGETNRFNWNIELYSSIVALGGNPAFLR